MAKSRPTEKVLSAPLNTITNEVNWKSRASVTISTSPTFHSVTEAQKKIAELQSRQSKPTPQGRGTKTPGRKYVQEMQKKVSEKITTPSRAPRSAGTINIPMNKVTELKKMLNESKMKEMQRLKHAQLNAKKRAEITDRVNTVRELLKGLNGAVHHNGAVVKTSKGEELNLPRDRVSAMKAWLKEFEKNNKEHANKWNNTTVSTQGKTRAYVPRTGSRNHQPVETYNQDGVEEAFPAVEVHDGKKVKEMTQWLDDFGKENQDFQSRRSSIDATEYDNDEEFDDAWIEGTSILKKAHEEREDLNMSMMPATGVSFNGEDIMDEESDWEDDYKDLMMTVDIQQINSKESWDKESVISPRNFAETESSEVKVTEEKTHQVATMVEDEASVTEEEAIQQDEDQDQSIDIEDEPESNPVQGHDLDDSNVEAEHVDPEDNVLTFNCYDSMSRVSFDGQPVDVKPECIIPVDEIRNYDLSRKSSGELAGEDIMERNDNDVNASIYVNRFTDNSMIASGAVRNPPLAQTFPSNRKKNRISMFFSSLNCMKNAKTSRAAAEYTNSYEEVEHNKRETPFLSVSSKNYLTTHNEEEDDESKAEDFNNAYLPARYAMGNPNVSQNVAREMALQGKGKAHLEVPQSPVSLASAFRRQMSPDSSCVSGFTDVESCVMMRNNDIGEHVRHLQGLFRSPVRVPSRRLCQF